MSQPLLVSQEWCDLVFEGRNKAYGAYVLRKSAGRRYRMVALILGGMLLAIVATVAVLAYAVFRQVDAVKEELQQVVNLKPLPTKEGFEVKRISAGRRAVHARVVKGGKNTAPDIVDRKVIAAPIGIDGHSDLTAPEPDELRDLDVHHNADRKDLPIEGAQLVTTETVEEMPLFPGGIPALMKYLEESVLYSGAAQRRKVEGLVEISFIVEADSAITNIKIDKQADPALNRAVLTAIMRMPKWTPGKKNGQPVPVKVTLPVRFALN